MVSFKSIMVSEPQVCLCLKTQSPSTLRWRLRVEVRHTCSFDAPLGLMDIRRYRSAVRLFLVLNHMPDRGTMARQAKQSFDTVLLCNLDS
jgi:hypothetical protein